jgi:hypothetical protein
VRLIAGKMKKQQLCKVVDGGALAKSNAGKKEAQLQTLRACGRLNSVDRGQADL